MANCATHSRSSRRVIVLAMSVRAVCLWVLFLVVAVVAQAPALPPIHKRQLSNGLPVWIVEHHDLAVVQMSLLVLKGTGDDPPGRFGIASLTSAMLTRGAGSRSAAEIEAEIFSLGANVSASSGIDSTSLQLNVNTGQFSRALGLMADLAERPTFPAEELERLRQERLATLRFAREDPDAIASLAFSRVVYGPSHRYGTSLIGTDDTVRGFTPADLAAFHASAYQPSNSALIVVGDVVVDEALRLLESHFGKWQARTVNAGLVGLSPVPQNARRRVTLIDKANAPQSRIRIGGVGAARSTPDFYAIEVMNTVLSSRLSANLRRYASSAGSGFDMRRGPGPFVAAAAVQADSTAESLTEMFATLDGMLTAVPADELARAKDVIARRFPTTFEATGRISSRLQAVETVRVYGLPDEYYATYLSAIQGVTAADVQRVARAYAQPTRLVAVVVGDLKAIEPGIRALNLAPVAVMTTDEVFAPAR